jgi:hypothetical protein
MYYKYVNLITGKIMKVILERLPEENMTMDIQCDTPQNVAEVHDVIKQVCTLCIFGMAMVIKQSYNEKMNNDKFANEIASIVKKYLRKLENGK